MDLSLGSTIDHFKQLYLYYCPHFLLFLQVIISFLLLILNISMFIQPVGFLFN
mgnify:CR=1 FL=1